MVCDGFWLLRLGCIEGRLRPAGSHLPEETAMGSKRRRAPGRRNWLCRFKPQLLIENLRLKTDGLPIQMGTGVVLAPRAAGIASRTSMFSPTGPSTARQRSS